MQKSTGAKINFLIVDGYDRKSRDDLAAARREVEPLSGSSRAPVASWIDKVDAREAALAASRQFAASAAAALPKPAQ